MRISEMRRPFGNIQGRSRPLRAGAPHRVFSWQRDEADKLDGHVALLWELWASHAVISSKT